MSVTQYCWSLWARARGSAAALENGGSGRGYSKKKWAWWGDCWWAGGDGRGDVRRARPTPSRQAAALQKGVIVVIVVVLARPSPFSARAVRASQAAAVSGAQMSQKKNKPRAGGDAQNKKARAPRPRPADAPAAARAHAALSPCIVAVARASGASRDHPMRPSAKEQKSGHTRSRTRDLTMSCFVCG